MKDISVNGQQVLGGFFEWMENDGKEGSVVVRVVVIDGDLHLVMALRQPMRIKPKELARLTEILHEHQGAPPAVSARCDWHGRCGESAQCSSTPTMEIDQRQLCPEHYEQVKALDAWKRSYIAR